MGWAGLSSSNIKRSRAGIMDPPSVQGRGRCQSATRTDEELRDAYAFQPVEALCLCRVRKLGE